VKDETQPVALELDGEKLRRYSPSTAEALDRMARRALFKKIAGIVFAILVGGMTCVASMGAPELAPGHVEGGR